MRGLQKIPGEQDLIKIYSTLQFANPSLSLKEIALWSQYCRFDSRLGELLMSALEKYWTKISPLEFNAALLEQPWPAAFGVLLEQMRVFSPRSGLELVLFKKWSDCVMAGVQKAKDELFFIGSYGFAGAQMSHEVLYANKTFRKWGYFGADILFNKARSDKKTLISASLRLPILNSYLKNHSRLTVEQYRSLFEGWVSKRQAQYDLSAHPRLKARGNTRARVFVVE